MMMRIRKFFGLSCILLLLTWMPNVEAASGLDQVVDDANLLSSAEKEALEEQLDEISEEYMFDVVVHTTNTLEGKTPVAYTDDFFDYEGYGYGSTYDGIILMISMEDNDWQIGTTGYGIEAFTDAGIDTMADEILPYLSSGNFYRAFQTFGEQVEEYLIQDQVGEPYDVGNLPTQSSTQAGSQSKASLGFDSIMLSIGIGFVAALIIVLSFRRELKSVRSQPRASSYVVKDSFVLTKDSDRFLYENITKRKKPQNNSSGGGSSTRIGSSGRSHGGRGGKF